MLVYMWKILELVNFFYIKKILLKNAEVVVWCVQLKNAMKDYTRYLLAQVYYTSESIHIICQSTSEMRGSPSMWQMLGCE